MLKAALLEQNNGSIELELAIQYCFSGSLDPKYVFHMGNFSEPSAEWCNGLFGMSTLCKFHKIDITFLDKEGGNRTLSAS
jgi:hypothetical protein